MNHFRKSTLLKENLDEKHLQSIKIKKKEYQQMLLAQIEDKKKAKQNEKETEKKREAEINKYINKHAKNNLLFPEKKPDHCFQKKNGDEELVPPFITLNNVKKLSDTMQPSVKTFPRSLSNQSKSLLPNNLPSSPCKSADKRQLSKARLLPTFFKNNVTANNFVEKQLDNLEIKSAVNQNCINTTLSRDYVKMYNNSQDYGELVQDNKFVKGSSKCQEYMKKMPPMSLLEAKDIIMREGLRKQLVKLKKLALQISLDKTKSELELLGLKAELKEIKEIEKERMRIFERQFNNLENSLEEQEAIYSYLEIEDRNQLKEKSEFRKKDEEENKKEQQKKSLENVFRYIGDVSEVK